MKKHSIIIAFFFVLISFAFTGCEWLLSLFGEIEKIWNSPTSNIYLYPALDYYSDTVQLNVNGQNEICYEIEYSSLSSPTTVDFILKSSDDKVAIPLNDKISTSSTEGSFFIQAVGEGNCEIRMYVDGFENVSVSYDVIYVKVTPEMTVQIVDENGNPVSNLKMSKGSEKTLYYKNTYDNNSVSWSAEDSSIVSVTKDSRNNGHIIAKAVGTRKINLHSSDDRVSDYCVVQVFDTSKWSISVTASSMPQKILPGDTFDLTCKVTVDEGIKQDVNWESTNRAVVKVDEKGKVTAVGVGTASIIAVLADNPDVKSEFFKITVSAPPVACNQFFWGQVAENG